MDSQTERDRRNLEQLEDSHREEERRREDDAIEDAYARDVEREILRLRRLTWAALQREALEAGIPVGRVSAAATRDELRLAILEARGLMAPAEAVA